MLSDHALHGTHLHHDARGLLRAAFSTTHSSMKQLGMRQLCLQGKLMQGYRNSNVMLKVCIEGRATMQNGSRWICSVTAPDISAVDPWFCASVLLLSQNCKLVCISKPNSACRSRNRTLDAAEREFNLASAPVLITKPQDVMLGRIVTDWLLQKVTQNRSPALQTEPVMQPT